MADRRKAGGPGSLYVGIRVQDAADDGREIFVVMSPADQSLLGRLLLAKGFRSAFPVDGGA